MITFLNSSYINVRSDWKRTEDFDYITEEENTVTSTYGKAYVTKHVMSEDLSDIATVIFVILTPKDVQTLRENWTVHVNHKDF